MDDPRKSDGNGDPDGPADPGRRRGPARMGVYDRPATPITQRLVPFAAGAAAIAAAVAGLWYLFG